MPRLWCWIWGLRSRLWLGIEGWVNRWWAGGSNSNVRGARPPSRGALIHTRWKLRSLLCGGGYASWRRRTSFGKSQRLLRVSAPKHQRFELMDARKASSSVALMAKVLGVTRAGYYAWKNRASHRGERALVRRRLDEAVAWEYKISGGTYEAPSISHALTRAGVDVGVRAVAASMRRQGLTGLNTHPRPVRCGGRPLVVHEYHCARQWDQGGLDRVWIADVTYLRCAQGWVYLCAVRDAHSRRFLGYTMGEQHNTRSGHHRTRYGRRHPWHLPRRGRASC